MTNIKTTIHVYRFDLSNPEEEQAYESLCDMLKERGLRKFDSISEEHSRFYRMIRPLDGKEIELETKFLFENQWNTAPIDGVSEKGLRVFDWAEAIYPNRKLREGHFLVQTDEMKEIRRNMGKCGFCGHMEPLAKGNVFCGECLDSPYLDQEQLHLLRLLPIDADGPRSNRPELTEGEKENLVPRYVHAQTVAEGSRAKAIREKLYRNVKAKAEKAIETAVVERDGMLWLLDHNVNVENVIFYGHTGRFCIGWRKPVSEAVKDELLDIISEFPFPYDIKWTGGTLSGER